MRRLISYSFTGLVTSKRRRFNVVLYLFQQTGREAISTPGRTLARCRLPAPSIVYCNYLFAKWILSTCSPRCCHSWGERCGEDWRRPPHSYQCDTDTFITSEGFPPFFFMTTLHTFALTLFTRSSLLS